VTACVRFPAPDGSRVQEVRQFKTTVGGLLVLHDWLKAHGVTHVAMEATGVYWKPVWAILEDSFELLLVNARHVKQVPGRKTDVKDAEWLCQLLEAGLLQANRLHKALEPAGIKLDCVATDILGKSGRAMLDALCSGTTDPEVLAELARGRMRTKIPQLKEALEGRFDARRALLISAILAHLDFLDEQIERLSDAIEEQLRPFQPAVELLRSLGGIETRSAQNIIAEIGTDMSIFPTADHLCSWAKQCPGNNQSAGKRKSGKNPKGPKWLDDALKHVAMAAIRTNDSYLQTQYKRLKPRVGHGRALGAVKHSILRAIWHMLKNGELYRDLGGDYFRKRDPERQTKRLVAQLERLGHKVTLESLPEAA